MSIFSLNFGKSIELSSWSFRGLLIILVSLHYGPCSTSCSVGTSTFSGELSWCLPSLSCPQLQVTIPYLHPRGKMVTIRRKMSCSIRVPIGSGQIAIPSCNCLFHFQQFSELLRDCCTKLTMPLILLMIQTYPS